MAFPGIKLARMSDISAITVILPCHNVADHVGSAIASLRAQEFSDFEALVIDDGSTDKTVARAQKAIGGDARFRVIQTPHRGLSAARNIGLDAAKAPLIAFLDADDAFAPSFLQRHHDEMLRMRADWTTCAVTLVWPDGQEAAHSAIHGEPKPKGSTRWLPMHDTRDVARLFPSVWNKLYRRELIGDLRFIDGALFEDHPFFWSLATRVQRILHIPEPLYRYARGRAGQITENADIDMFQQLERLKEVIALARASMLTNKTEGLSQLATRVIHERQQTQPAEQLRTHFLNEARHVMKTHGLRWSRNGANDIDPAPAPLLDPEFRISVLVLQEHRQDADGTLNAIKAQTLPPVMNRLVPLEGKTVLATLAAHLPDVKSSWVSILFAGDCPAPDWVIKSLEFAQSGASATSVVCGASRNGMAVYACEPAQPEAPVAPDPAMLIMRTDHLRELLNDKGGDLLELPDPVAMVCLASLLRAKHGPLHILPDLLLHLSTRPVLPMAQTARVLRKLSAEICVLSPKDRAAIFASLAQLELTNAATRPSRFGIAARAGFARWRSGLPVPAPAAHIGPYLQLCLGQS